MPEFDVLRRDVGAVRELTLSNPARRNALNDDLLERLWEELDQAMRDGQRCVMIRGEGDRAFSSGYDLTALPSSSSDDELPDEALVRTMERLGSNLIPTVALLNGHAFGGGLELAARCDLRVAVAGSLFGMPPAKLGIVYATEGLARFFALLGASGVRRLFLTGAPISAAEALRIGLVDEVYPTLAEAEERALALAAEIATNAPLALEGTLQILRDLEYAMFRGVDRQTVHNVRREAFDSEDAREGRAAFLEKRAPVFKGR